MEKFRNQSVLSSALLMLAVAVILIIFLDLSSAYLIYLSNLLSSNELSPSAGNYLIFCCLAIISGLLAEKFSVKRILPFVFVFLGIWFLISFLAVKYLAINLFFLRVSILVLITIFAVHVKKLWLIDSALTDKLVSLSSTGHVLEGKSADLRIESGLKLLETVLPLSDAIVFRLETNNELNPVGRARSDTADDTLFSRQTAWLENVALCEKAFNLRETVVETDKSEAGSARIALPLIYEGNAIGVLFVKVHKIYEQADKNLLEAFSSQLARNFQRKELRSKNLPHKTWWSGLSTQSAENRLDIAQLIDGIMKEQSFSAFASSYLKEAHAIAYLDGTLAYLNRQMRHLAKLSPHEFFQIDLFSLLERFKTEVFNEPSLAIRRVLQTDETYRCELFYPENNKTLKLRISLVKAPDDEQSIHDTNVAMKPACFLITISNISAVKENQKLRSDMASLMSHELRTPITSIRGFAELLLLDESVSQESREFLEIINNESQRLSKMLSTFLSVANLEQSDKTEVSKTPVKLDAVVREVVDEMTDIARKKRIRLVEQANAHLPPVAADKGLITRAVSHLIENAIKYSPEKTSVIISTILESDFLRVVVEDRGYGIDKSEHEKIWQKFYRVAREGQDKEEESTGLGLSFVKEIVEQHGGAVEVESEVGTGSKFSFKLPRL